MMPISAAGGHLAIKQAQNGVVIAFQPSHIIGSVKELAMRKISRDLEQVKLELKYLIQILLS